MSGFEEQFEPMLENYRIEWENGVWRAVMDAFEVCSENGLRFPVWLRRAVMDELFYSYEHRPRGGAMSRTGRRHNLSKYLRQARYHMMCGFLEWQEKEIALGVREPPINKTEAAKEVASRMHESGDDARGTWCSILETYDQVAKSLKSGSE